MLEIVSNVTQVAAKGAPQSGPQKSKTAKAAPALVVNIPGERQADPGAAVQRLDPLDKIEKSLTELLNSYLGDHARLSIEEHKTGRYIYRSVDVDSGEVIQQWPAEDFLRQLEHFAAEDPNLVRMAGRALNEVA